MRRRPETLLGLVRRFSRLWGFALFLIFVVILFRQIALPFVFATVVAYLLAPLIKRLEPRTGRFGAVSLVYVVIAAVLALFFGWVLPAVVKDMARLRDALPATVATLNEEWIPRVSGWFDHTFEPMLAVDAENPPTSSELVMVPLGDGSWQVDLEGVRLEVQETREGTWIIRPPPEGPTDLDETLRRTLATKGAELTRVIAPALQAFATGVASFLTKLILTFMLAAFILIDLHRVNRFIRSLVPSEYRVDFDELLGGMDKGLAGVIRGQLLICLINGVLTYIGLVIFGIKYSFLLALVAGVFSLIPIFGTIASSIPIVLIGLVSGEQGVSLGPAVGILGWIAGIHLLEANVLNPKIIGEAAKIHPVIVVFALLAGEHVYGLVGALLAVPVASMVQTAFLYARRHSSVFARDREPPEARA